MFPYRCLVVVAGFLLDLVIGDPHIPFHPVVLIGKLISLTERLMYRGKGKILILRGAIFALIVMSVTGGTVYLILFLIRPLPLPIRFFTEALLCSFVIAVKDLKRESMQVYHDLDGEKTDLARRSLSMIVGRDTENLDEEGIVKAAVESVAESTCDGIIAPLFFLLLGGPVAGYIYRAVNTMDSMTGYRNERYEYFGKAAARLDDLFNLIPSRIAALLLILSAFLDSEAKGGRSFKVWMRDRYNHSSINSGQTEAAASGALGISLGGAAYYKGILNEKRILGEDMEGKADKQDIIRINRLMYRAAFTFILIPAVYGGFFYA